MATTQQRAAGPSPKTGGTLARNASYNTDTCPTALNEPLRSAESPAREIEYLTSIVARQCLHRHRDLQVRALYGLDGWIKWKVAAAVVTQLYMCHLVSAQSMSWPLLLLLAYCIGGVINHSMTLAMHEVSHNRAFKSIRVNRWFGMVANLPLGIPSFASFKSYHMDHHQYQGEDVIDVDVPTAAEARIFTTTPRKAFWMFIQAAFYALRPFMLVTKRPTVWDGLNWVVQVAFDAVVYYFFGSRGKACCIHVVASRRCIARWSRQSLARLPDRLFIVPHVFVLTFTARNCRLGVSHLQHAAGHGHAPNGWPLCCRALHVCAGPGDVLVLRAAQLVLVQCGLPQRAPRLPFHSGLAPAGAAPHCAGVL